MGLAILTCLNERPAISRILLNTYGRLNDRGAFCELVAVCHNDDDAKLAAKGGAHVVMHPNQPLGDKWNAGLAAVIEKDYTHVLIMGDDDSISDEAVKLMKRKAGQGYQYLGYKVNGFVDTNTGKAIKHTQKHACDKLIGAGRLISVAAIKRAMSMVQVQFNRDHVSDDITYPHGHTMWVTAEQAHYLSHYSTAKIVKTTATRFFPALKNSMDHHTELRLVLSGTVPVSCDDDRVHVTDFKSSRNIWPYSILEKKCSSLSFEEATWYMSNKEVDYIRGLKR